MTTPYPYDPILSRYPAYPGRARVKPDDANFVQRNLNEAAQQEASNLRKVGMNSAPDVVNSGVVAGATVSPTTQTVAGTQSGSNTGARPGQVNDPNAISTGPQLTPFSMFRQTSPAPQSRASGAGGFYPSKPLLAGADDVPAWLQWQPTYRPGMARIA